MRRLLLVSSVVVLAGGEDFGYPELAGQRLDSSDGEARTPLYIPGRCPENQWLYPGDQKTDWICDCQPGYLYLPQRDKCYAAYRRGPCPFGEHLVLKKKQVIPECVWNPCTEGLAKYDRVCYELDKQGGPCGPLEEGSGIFGINATTLEPECLKGTDLISLKYHRPCRRGSIRKKCR